MPHLHLGNGAWGLEDATVKACFTWGALRAEAAVGVGAILASASILTGLTEALVDVGLAQAAREASFALAAERGQAILAGAVVAGVWCALVDVKLTVLSGVAWVGDAQDGRDLISGTTILGPIMATDLRWTQKFGNGLESNCECNVLLVHNHV